ncbi:hypothetical protein EON66_08925 [archaeon]|nr:MAG: hypothetical protein EON66_08925 [archaeon]
MRAARTTLTPRLQWLVACIMFSAAVSVKMNVLLMAPGLLFLLLRNVGVLYTVACLIAMVGVQVSACAHAYKRATLTAHRAHHSSRLHVAPGALHHMLHPVVVLRCPHRAHVYRLYWVRRSLQRSPQAT